MKIAVLLCGHIRSWDPEYFERIFPNVDVFVHTYNTVLGYHPYIQNTHNIQNNNAKLDSTVLSQIIRLNPKRIVIEDDLIQCVQDSENWPINMDTFQQYRKFYLCNALLSEYESVNGIAYDVIIKTRFDITYSINLKTMLQSYNDRDSVYISNGPGINPCDQIFIASSAKMTELSECLTDMSCKTDSKLSPHEWVQLRVPKIKYIDGLYTTIVRVL